MALIGMGAAIVISTGLLSGCAGTQGVNGASSAEPITESDEPDTRKRARLRTTLATSYFEQGQDTVALDEIKQALVADVNYGPAYVLRGLVYMRLNNPGLSEDSFRRALQINAKDPDALHNYGWFLCSVKREKEAVELFSRAVANPTYSGQAKTLMTKGVCEIRAGLFKDAEESFARSYQLDSTNPVAGYNLAALLFKRGESERAQFYIRRLNATELANAETLWLGIKIEKQMKNQEVADQLAQQLQKRFPDSNELKAYRRGAFYE
ncbi:type IV pilus biogenesis/stability protein PilW [Hydrogenophaga crassostreae]|uniref:Type IV pilus biogenesis/stability protein PilW n=2 Tax=Hydrogenophaga crassostreae TaxID=1763535 RepID=A0A163CIM5_9BURK|nr:type IV pilus biogenesis/stability protein PilW [Hydrogenophaga crassostreae]OAD42590.1 type IV pilus biogenesis/stability protein PilW [Hydrogenophaga crassostreae]